MTGTEMLAEVIGRFEAQGEPRAMLVIWTDNEGCVNMKSNCENTHTAGMGIYAAATALFKIIREPEEITRGKKGDLN
jgi:hypothetical protein